MHYTFIMSTINENQPSPICILSKLGIIVTFILLFFPNYMMITLSVLSLCLKAENVVYMSVTASALTFLTLDKMDN